MSRRPVSEGQKLAAVMNEESDRSAAMAAVASRFTGFRQASKVLTRVRGVRTIFPGVDLITRIGGWPIMPILGFAVTIWMIALLELDAVLVGLGLFVVGAVVATGRRTRVPTVGE